MDRLANFPLNEPRKIRQLRQKYEATPGSAEIQSELGIALASGGCTYEATALLRPTRSVWKSSPRSGRRNFRSFRHKHGGTRTGGNSRIASMRTIALAHWPYWETEPSTIGIFHRYLCTWVTLPVPMTNSISQSIYTVEFKGWRSAVFPR